MIRIEHLKKEYPNAVPLKDVNVEINDGDALDTFVDKYNSRISKKILLYTRDYQKDCDIFCYPMYWAGFLI